MTRMDIPIEKDTYKNVMGKPIIADATYNSCPFCGQIDNGESLQMMETNPSEIMGRERFYIECKACAARGPDDSSLTGALEGWNRVPSDWRGGVLVDCGDCGGTGIVEIPMKEKSHE